MARRLPKIPRPLYSKIKVKIFETLAALEMSARLKTGCDAQTTPGASPKYLCAGSHDSSKETNIVPLSKMLGACALGASLAASFLGAVPAVRAQATLTPPDTLLPTAGTKEIGVAGNYSFNGDKPYAVQGSYGVFTAPTVEFGGVAAISGATHSTTASSIGAFGNYYFASAADNPLLPYLGLFAGYTHLHDDTASVGAQGGVKYFFNR